MCKTFDWKYTHDMLISDVIMTSPSSENTYCCTLHDVPLPQRTSGVEFSVISAAALTAEVEDMQENTVTTL